MTLPTISAAPLKAAMDAAWPGLPAGMTLDEAERRTRAALAAAYPHLTTDRPADARIGALLQLTQGLMQRYVELAGALGEHITDEAIRRELVETVQTVAGEVSAAIEEITRMPV